jgi:hypothetical protein
MVGKAVNHNGCFQRLADRPRHPSVPICMAAFDKYIRKN